MEWQPARSDMMAGELRVGPSGLLSVGEGDDGQPDHCTDVGEAMNSGGGLIPKRSTVPWNADPSLPCNLHRQQGRHPTAALQDSANQEPCCSAQQLRSPGHSYSEKAGAYQAEPHVKGCHRQLQSHWLPGERGRAELQSGSQAHSGAGPSSARALSKHLVGWKKHPGVCKYSPRRHCLLHG
ncbi:hypothetical protein NDU88_006717 [Pleurodeles waltl]|uniref:Uncharacterized protein n=1 Tax=Pleurodeles waltl TaxID=8319 RepID=A0AAV7LTH2_PLEWA|nr:hypothetical protein NDU88_006717 [Pleurodeles waltl]